MPDEFSGANFLFQLVYKEFLPSCYVKYSISFFLVYLPVSRIKVWEILQFLTLAICNYCYKDVSVANMVEAALKSHMKGKKHVERSPSDQCIRSLNYWHLLPLWSFWKLVCLKSEVWYCYCVLGAIDYPRRSRRKFWDLLILLKNPWKIRGINKANVVEN